MPETFETGGAKARTLPEGTETRGVVVEVAERDTRYGKRAVMVLNVEGAPKGSNPIEYWLPRTLRHPLAGSRVRMMRTAARHYKLEIYAPKEAFPPVEKGEGALKLDAPEFTPAEGK